MGFVVHLPSLPVVLGAPLAQTGSWWDTGKDHRHGQQSQTTVRGRVRVSGPDTGKGFLSLASIARRTKRLIDPFPTLKSGQYYTVDYCKAKTGRLGNRGKKTHTNTDTNTHTPTHTNTHTHTNPEHAPQKPQSLIKRNEED